MARCRHTALAETASSSYLSPVGRGSIPHLRISTGRRAPSAPSASAALRPPRRRDLADPEGAGPCTGDADHIGISPQHPPSPPHPPHSIASPPFPATPHDLIARRPRLAVALSRSPPRRRGEHPCARPSTA
ncbi:hypothetical protein PVAP13_5NG195962 [Panicum virgatum]|uniref:Uncharacterized protein n=1 Tax=Panicum virgatum TaxID=38727 RepID=A0A8T0RS64_PANVG|nr:hypothetical protein PVAP13_5NG195962 [Panicum virgatum]